VSRNLQIVALISFVNNLSFTILIPNIYIYGQQFNLNDWQISLLFVTYSVAQFFATPVIGKLSDSFGRKPLLIISLIGTVIANTIAGLAPNAIWLFFGRFLDGITGGNVSVAQAIITDVTPPADRVKGFGLLGATIGAAFVFGPLLSLAAQQISIGTSFLISAVLAAIATIATIFLLPETIPQKQPFTFNIKNLGLQDLAAALFFPRVGILFFINLCIGTTFTIFTFAFQPYFLQVLKQNYSSLSLLFFTFGTFGVLMQTVGLKQINKYLSPTAIMCMGIGVRGVCFLLMPLLPNVAYFVTVGIAFSIFNSLVQPALGSLVSLNSSPQEQGRMSGLNASFLSISNAFGPPIAGFLVSRDRPITYGHALYVAGFFTLIIFIYAIFNRRQYRIEKIQ
jgi:MFS family permease